MKIRSLNSLFLRAVGGVAVMAGTASATQGWHRATDWVPGTVQGSSINNPSTVGGAATWQYESVRGGGLGSVNPGYAQSSSLMTWDSNWYNTGWGVWSKGDNLNPPVLPGRMVHNVDASVWDDVPLVRWLSPLGNGSQIDITGTLTVNWNGVNGVGRPVNVDVIIARHIAATNSNVLLFSSTVSKPNPFPSVGDSRLLPVSLLGITLNAGDSIMISQRGQNAVGPLGAWVNLYDDISISSAVPAPGAAGLLSMAGLQLGVFGACIISSVVPQSIFNLRNLARRYLHVEPLVVGENAELGIEIRRRLVAVAMPEAGLRP